MIGARRSAAGTSGVPVMGLWGQVRRRFSRRAATEANPVPIRDWVNVGQGSTTKMAGFDQAMVWVVMGLLALGMVMVYSASIALPDNPRFANYQPTHFLTRHLLALTIAMLTALVVVQIPLNIWEKAAPWIFVISLILLVMVLIPGIGKVVNKSRRWIPMGVMNFQPSELAKVAMCMYAASYMVRKMEARENFVRAVWPMAIALGFTGVLLLREPDMGAFMVVALISMGVLFLGGVNGRMFFLSAAMLIGTFVLVITFSDEKRERIFAYLQPWDPAFAQGKAYQLTHSLIAFGRGEWFGQGLGGSLEKLHYLPEAHTDFLLAVIGEELGFVGVACVIVAFFWLTRRIFHVGRQAIALDR
ncbi:MAG: putative peptidoglycan glycosyltransferase FtsW, partial [Pseudomonadota bacterium]